MDVYWPEMGKESWEPLMHHIQEGGRVLVWSRTDEETVALMSLQKEGKRGLAVNVLRPMHPGVLQLQSALAQEYQQYAVMSRPLSQGARPVVNIPDPPARPTADQPAELLVPPERPQARPAVTAAASPVPQPKRSGRKEDEDA